MYAVLSSLGLAVLLLSSPAFANEALAKKNNCIGCHHMTDKKVGPTWKAIADKYKGQPDAEKVLTESIVKGAKDKFGKVPMPPQPKAKADAGKMAKWILTL